MQNLSASGYKPMQSEDDRKKKWLDHFDLLLKDDHPLDYGDYAALQALGLASVFGSSSLCLTDFPPGLKAWFDKMKDTSGVQATLSKNVDLMPKGRSFP